MHWRFVQPVPTTTGSSSGTSRRIDVCCGEILQLMIVAATTELGMVNDMAGVCKLCHRTLDTVKWCGTYHGVCDTWY